MILPNRTRAFPEGGYHQPGPRLRGPARWRLLTVSVVFAVAFAAVGGKLMLNAAPRTVSPANAAVLPDGGGREFAPRASIVDRRGELLAYSLPFDSLYANPQEVRDPAKVAAALQTVLPDLRRLVLLSLSRTRNASSLIWLAPDA